MAKTYTYEDFEKALQNSGLSGQFSSADLALAKRNPDAGMSLLNYKNDYMNATTDEMRALANSGAESIRKQYGEYSGGADGSGFYLEPPSPGSFTSDTAPTFTDNYAADLESLLLKNAEREVYSFDQSAPTFTDNYADDLEALLLKNAEREAYSFDQSAPVYKSPYGNQISGLLGELTNREAFSYDHTTDPLYSSYAKQYTREGKRATADALGEAASATGGIPSSYAVTAASQAGDYYASQLADKIPELYQIAYDKYLQEYQMKLSDINALQQQEAFAYGQYQDQLGQYNTDRNFDYAKWLDQYEMDQKQIDTLRALRGDEYDMYLNQLGQYNTDRNFDYAKWLDQYEMDQNQIDTLRALRGDEYDMYLTQLGQYNTDRNFDYTQYLDEIDSQTLERNEEYQREQDEYNRAWDEEERAYQREQDAYDRMVDEENRAYTRAKNARSEELDLAELAAQFGDYDALRALGIDVDEETLKKSSSSGGTTLSQQRELAELAAKYGDYDLLRELGIEPNREENRETAAAEGYVSEADADAAVEDQIKQLVSEGYDTTAIRAMLARAKKEGLLSSSGYARLFDKYARGTNS